LKRNDHFLKNPWIFITFYVFPQKEPPTCENLPPRIKQKILLVKGVSGIQLFNGKISPNYVSFISSKVNCIATLLEKII